MGHRFVNQIVKRSIVLFEFLNAGVQGKKSNFWLPFAFDHANLSSEIDLVTHSGLADWRN